jgi:hypothetical protein
MGVVLQLNENMLAKTLDRPIKEIDDAEIEKNINLADTNHDNNVTKEELKSWIINHLKKDEHHHNETCLAIAKITSET